MRPLSFSFYLCVCDGPNTKSDDVSFDLSSVSCLTVLNGSFSTIDNEISLINNFFCCFGGEKAKERVRGISGKENKMAK